MSIDWIPTKPSRKITAKEIGNRGIFPSTKAPEGILEYESCLERDFLIEANHCPSVKVIQHQPIQIRYTDHEGKSRTYTPDAYIEYKNGIKVLYEVKYEEEIKNKVAKYIERWENAKKWAENHKMIFMVISEKIIRTARWYNIWFMLGASKCKVDQNLLDILIKITPLDGITYGNLCQNYAEVMNIDKNKSAQIICYAIYYGHIQLDDFSKILLSNSSIVRSIINNDAPFE